MYQFPKDLYADIRIEESYSLWLGVHNGELDADGIDKEKGAYIRVFDGKMWYTCSTCYLDEIQKELDNLASLATPNPDIMENPIVKNFEVHQEKVLRFEGEKDVRSISRAKWKELLDYYIDSCIDESIPEISAWNANVSCGYKKKSFYSSKGSQIIQDMQACSIGIGYGITVDGVTTGGGRSYTKFSMEDLLGHEEEIVEKRMRDLDFAKNAVNVEPGEYTCVLSPMSTAMFAHESFGHKSEADYMLNDKNLQDEWVIGKQVGSELVSICDRGDWLNHGYTPYDDEGILARETWLMKDGVLTGRLHNAESASILGEELTGNARADGPLQGPTVRMTNTYMAAGKDEPQKIIEEVKDGIYIYDVACGTGQATFTINPTISYRIRDGKLCEPLRIHVLTGNVFETLFEVDAVGTDLEIFDTYTCGKAGQTVLVSSGGPTIRVRRLTVN